jgi:hypothetical protein
MGADGQVFRGCPSDFSVITVTVETLEMEVIVINALRIINIFDISFLKTNFNFVNCEPDQDPLYGLTQLENVWQ